MDYATALRRAWGERVHSHRLARGLSLRGLAGRAGVDHVMILKVERGEVDASTQVKIKIADALGVDPEELFSLTAAKRPERRETAVA